MRTYPCSSMVQIYGRTTKFDKASTFHETSDTKIKILTFLGQANEGLAVPGPALTIMYVQCTSAACSQALAACL